MQFPFVAVGDAPQIPLSFEDGVSSPTGQIISAEVRTQDKSDNGSQLGENPNKISVSRRLTLH